MPTGRPSCIGSKSFDAEDFFAKWARGELATPKRESNDLRHSILNAFGIPYTDKYVYHATASVTLGQVQQAINVGGQHGLHAWYVDENGQAQSPPPAADIDAYRSVFSSTTSTDKTLKAFASNAKKNSSRSRVAQNLTTKRSFPANITIPKLKTPHPNPYLDFWSWSCHNLEWCGPEDATSNIKQSHHILPVFYHHFGCVVPGYEALETIRQLAAGRAVIDAGSGNGYWTYMLRRMGLEVTPLDDATSVWRTMWIGDTIKTDAGKYITREKQGAADAVLLMVYPQVTTGFTKDTLKAYKGDTVCVAGTQNSNIFTADVGKLLEELGGGWEKIVQTPLPSFAGKDDALFVWQRNKT